MRVKDGPIAFLQGPERTHRRRRAAARPLCARPPAPSATVFGAKLAFGIRTMIAIAIAAVARGRGMIRHSQPTPMFVVSYRRCDGDNLMPHLVILYSGNLDAQANMGALCRSLADTLLAQVDEAGATVFPPGGTRVLAYPAPRFAIADGQHDCAFAYLNLRMGPGRTEATQQRIGEALLAIARAFFEPIQARRLVGVTLQIDVGAEVFDAQLGNIHSLFETG